MRFSVWLLIFWKGADENEISVTMILHIALTMLVCYFVSRKKDFVGIVICLLLHWLVDFVTPLINGMATEYGKYFAPVGSICNGVYFPDNCDNIVGSGNKDFTHR